MSTAVACDPDAKPRPDDGVEGQGAKMTDAEMGDRTAMDPALEARVRRKMDRNFLLLLCFLFLLSFLDRSNIGNARIAGMADDLDLDSNKYDWLLTIFYIGYILFEPLILMFKVVSPKSWVAFIVLGWGIAATAQAGATSWAGMMICRFFLAAFEAGYGPGAIYLLSFFYLRDEIGLRIGVFFCAAPLATCFAGALAYGITAGHASLANWRLLFLVEGLPVIVMSVVTYFAMPKSPHEAWFLTSEEKQVAYERSVRQAGMAKRVGGISWSETFSTLLDLKAWVTSLIYFSCNVSYSSLPVFLPTILHDMGYSGLDAQGLSAPPYFAAFLMTLATTYVADRTQQRGITVMILSVLAGVGYIMLGTSSSNGVRYAGSFLAAAGVFPTIANVLPWVLNNQGSDERRGAGVVMLNLVGQCGPLLGTRVYPGSDKPDYVKGHSICAGFMFFTTLLALFLRFWLARENRKLDRKYQNSDTVAAADDEVQGEAVENYGRNFRYVL